MLAISDLYLIPQQLQQFSADDIFDTESMDVAETAMGVDGNLAGGYVFVPVKMGVTLMANSKSNDIFDNWNLAQRQQKDLFFATMTALQPSLGKKWALSGGILSTWKPTPDAKKTLQPRKYMITWETIGPAPI